MVIYVNESGEIKDVSTTNDQNLIPLEILDDDENPFTNWSVAKICCHKVKVNNGHVVMLTPYVDSRIIDHIDQLANSIKINSSDIVDNQLALVDIYESLLTLLG